MTVSPLKRYCLETEKPDMFADPAQYEAAEKLTLLWEQLCEKSSYGEQTLINRFRAWAKNERGKPIKGLYLWGGVGRGKTWLMDLFYDELPFENKMRTHFHRFMKRVHHDLKHLKNVKNPLESVAERIAEEACVLCFDEFFVSDITDAMILARLLESLFAKNVVLVATSNVEPKNLYRDGLQRANFLPAIELIYQNVDVHWIASDTDYRLRALEKADLYYSPLNDRSHASLGACFERLVPDVSSIRANVPLEVEGRNLYAYREAEDVVWFEFRELCDGPRSQNDYIELAREYHAVILENLPVFNGQNDDQARRFINLVDEFYDRGVKLIISAESEIDSLYRSERLSFEFERTVSRILEMQSTTYLAREHRGD